MEIGYTSAQQFCVDVFAGHGFSRDESKLITDVLLRADLWGIESHGIQRLVRYHSEILSGMVSIGAQPQIVLQSPVSAVIDAQGAMGQLVSASAMNLAIEKAQQSGIGMIAVRDSNHYGIAGYYAEMAVNADLMGVCMTNTEAIGVPVLGKKAMLGTNPIALGFPADPINFIYDASTTVAPRGKVEVYSKNDKPLPEGWAVDTSGHDTTDSAALLHNIIHKLGGGIAPLGGTSEITGGHKGYGLGIIVDLFTGILSGGATSNYVNTRPGKSDITHFFMAVDYGIFGDKPAAKARLSAFLGELRESPKADGQERIYTHGEKEAEMMRQRKSLGTLPVNEKTWQEMQDIANQQKLDFGRYF